MQQDRADAWGTPTEMHGGFDDDETMAFVRNHETVAVSRKKVLLRLLAVREAERLGLTADAERLNRIRAAVARHFNPGSAASGEPQLTIAGLDPSELDRFVAEAALGGLVEEHYAQEIDRDLPLQRKLAAALQPQEDGYWAQFNISLERKPNGAVSSAVRIFMGLAPFLAPGCIPRGARHFFLMRKAPDLRLRIAGTEPGEVERTFTPLLVDFKNRGLIAEFYQVPYEPESFRFGGRRILGIVHSWFEADSIAWLYLEPLVYRRENQLSREILSLTILNDLFFSILKDAAEVWDVWHRLAVSHNVTFAGGIQRVPVAAITEMVPMAGRIEQEILHCYAQANQTVAEGLEQAARCGQLRVGCRALLHTLAMFHWNRYGLPAESRQNLIASMLHTLNPNPET